MSRRFSVGSREWPLSLPFDSAIPGRIPRPSLALLTAKTAATPPTSNPVLTSVEKFLSVGTMLKGEGAGGMRERLAPGTDAGWGQGWPLGGSEFLQPAPIARIRATANRIAIQTEALLPLGFPLTIRFIVLPTVTPQYIWFRLKNYAWHADSNK